jgi:hypothetical protein
MMRLVRRGLPGVLLATVLTAVLAACTATGASRSASGPETSQGAPSSGAGTSSAAPSPSPPPPAPRAKGCYQLGLGELTRPTNQSSPVSCRDHHDAQTIYVGTLDTVVNGHAVAVDSKQVQHQLERTCPRKLAQFVGGTQVDRNLSRFNVVWFSPTLQQSDQGANWFRCDLVAFAGQQTLLDLPPTKQLHHALNHSSALDAYGLCGTAAPGDKNFQRVICGHKHSWRAISTIRISGGQRYPGIGSVRTAGDSTCKSEVHQRAGYSLKYTYGWEWPSKTQWDDGQHYGYCWAPG